MSEKIQSHHLQRKAILYVRQSSVQQVLYHRESSALQRAMRDSLEWFGFTHVETIDDDLGRSASGSATRRIRAHGLASLPRQRGRGGGVGGVSFCP